MIINDEAIYKRIQSYWREERRIREVMKALQAIDMPVSSDYYYEPTRQHITNAVSLLKSRNKEINSKIKALKDKLSPTFWDSHTYSEV